MFFIRFVDMKKAKFTYKKEDGTITQRTIVNPSFLKESTNSLKDFSKTDVKYLSGIEIVSEGLTESQIREYEKAVMEYYMETSKTISQYLQERGLNPKMVAHKSFKKGGVSDLLIEEQGE